MKVNGVGIGLSICSLWLGLVSASQAQQTPRRSIENITGDVYLATNNFHRTVFMVTPEGIILCDPINAGFSEWFKAEAASRFGVPVRYVIYSHHHWDHASGGAVFADTAKFVGHANMLDYLAMPADSTRLSDIIGEFAEVAALDADGNGTVERAETAGELNDYQFTAYDGNGDDVLSGAEVARGPLRYVQPPDITYTNELEIELGGKRVNVDWVGEMNHSSDMSRISFPDDSALFVVDFVDVRRLPYQEMDYTNGLFEEWLAAIRETEEIARGFDYVASGHGGVGTAEDLAAWRGYMEELRDEVAAGIREGRSLEELQAAITMDDYSDWIGFDWVDLNVLGMYHFLTD